MKAPGVLIAALVAMSVAGCTDGFDDGADGTTRAPTPVVTVTATAQPEAAIDPRVDVLSAKASASATASEDGTGGTIAYPPENMTDADPTTAWRVDGDGVGIEVVLDLGDVTDISSVGLIPGYAKVDPELQFDRFTQNRRILIVEWDFADGTTVRQEFREEPTLQTIPVNATSNWVRIRIVATTEDGGRDFTAISDVEVLGKPRG